MQRTAFLIKDIQARAAAQDFFSAAEMRMNLDPLFSPKSIAVIGVSAGNDRHPANVIFNKNHLRYPLEVYAVNPRGGAYQGSPLYSDITGVPSRPDLAVIVVRADQVPDVLAGCIRAGVGGAIVVSGGFAETGQAALQGRVAAMAREARFPVIGPNCLGVFVPGRLDTFFLPSERMVRPDPGRVALVSQSGGILVDQMIKFREEGVGLSVAVSIGNKALLGETELLRHLAVDPATEVLAFYVEGFGPGEGRTFVDAAAACPKPVVILKSGKSPAGREAVTSHTASLAGDYDVFHAALAQRGVIEADSEQAFVSYCEALTCYPRGIGNRIGVITGSGGHGALAVDGCIAAGLAAPRFSPELQEQIRRGLGESIRTIAALGNPVDLTGSAVDEDFVAAASALLDAQEVDCLMLLLLPYLPGITSDLGARLSRIRERHGKPMVAYVPHVEKYRMFTEGFQLNRIPVSPSIEGAVRMAEGLRRCRRC